MLHSAESIFCSYDTKLKILFYCHGVGKITYDRFLKDCYFNSFCKGKKNFVLTSRYAKVLKKVITVTPRYAAKRRVMSPRYAA
jgi:hypothetical protein